MALWIDELRIVNGKAEWVANFTSPVSAYVFAGIDAALFAGEGTVAGALVAIESPSVVAFSVAVDWKGTFAFVDAADTTTFLGLVSAFGSLTVTEQASTAQFIGAERVATFVATEVSDAVAIAGSVAIVISGSLTAIDAISTANISGQVAGTIGVLFGREDVWIIPPALLMHFDGADGSTLFVDASGHGHVATAFGAAQIATASLMLGSSDYVSIAAGDDLALGTDDFDVDFRLEMAAVIEERNVLDWGGDGPIVKVKSDGTLVMLQGGVERIIGTTVINPDTPYHVALTRTSGTTRLFLSGNQEGSNYVASYSIGSGSILLGAGAGEDSFALLEDGSIALREDGSAELRE